MKRYFTQAILLLLLTFPVHLFSGITGTLSGYVKDKETGKALPGANVQIEGTTIGAMADKDGYFAIHNIPAGTYDVSANMIGYSKLTIKEVKINVDLTTELNFQLTSEVLKLEEVVVVNKRDLIQKEITSSTYFISGEQINRELPVSSFREAISLLPGVVGSHFRGGRETDVLYLLDGLPIQGALTREISSYFPNSSIVEMMVQTGGFSAEYGQATSGIVNIVSKEGSGQIEGGIKVYSDFFDTGVTGNDNTRRVEINVGGPLTIGLGGPLIHANYFVSADLNLSDTPWRKQMRKAFDSPIFKNYNINSKLTFTIRNNTLVTFQGLVSNWDWRKYDPQWRLNLFGLARHKHYSHRLSGNLTHTFSPRFYATLRLATYSYKREILGSVDSDPPVLIFQDPGDPTSPIVGGTQPWEEKTSENVNIVKLDLVRQFSSHQTLKTGIDFQSYDLDSRSLRFSALPVRNGAGVRYNKASNDFQYFPRFFALYVQDKFEVSGIIADLGLRYDVFNPRISVEELSKEFFALRPIVNSPALNKKSISHTTASPRLGVSIPLSEHERLHLNYGWYYQMPPLFYVFTNAEHNLTGYFPVLGNIELKPMKTIASEFSYKRVLSDNLLVVVTGFFKKFSNLVDTQAFVLPDSLITANTPTVGFSRYTNSAFGQAAGLEITLQKRLTRHLSGRVSYTYMKAKGTNSTAEDGFKSVAFGLPASSKTEFPLSWDQRHSIILDADYASRDWQFNLLVRVFSPLPFTTPESTAPNNARSSWRHFVDLKVVRATNLLGGRFKPFFEVRNLFNEENLFDKLDDTGIKGYRLFDPINSDLGGTRLRVGVTVDF